MPQVNRLTLPTIPTKQQAQNKIVWNGTRSLEHANFFTLGYTGRSIHDIVDILLANEVQTLVDIRQHAISMYRPELSKNNLAKLLTSHGLSYMHFPQLGVPRDIRAKAIERGSREVIWDWYDEHVINEFFGTGRNLHYFLNCVEHPVALMCTEIDPQECHRHRLSLALERMGMSGFDL
jgi:uncharacterized protein (DUF488 family)